MSRIHPAWDGSQRRKSRVRRRCARARGGTYAGGAFAGSGSPTAPGRGHTRAQSRRPRALSDQQKTRVCGAFVSGRRVQVGFPKPFFGVLRSVCGPDPRRVPACTSGLGVDRPYAQTGARLVSIRRRGGTCGAREASTKERSPDAPLGYTGIQSVSFRAVSSSGPRGTQGDSHPEPSSTCAWGRIG